MGTPKDPDATRRRIFDAASLEFSDFGIAGARVDRIAERAQANKAMIYRYFGSKDELFDSIFSTRIAGFIESVRFDTDDLGEYAGRLFDAFQNEPVTLRLTFWYQLERATSARLPALLESNERVLAGIVAAQQSGRITSDRSPTEVFTFLRGIALAWNVATPELRQVTPATRDEQRAAVVSAVRQLLVPKGITRG